jgi:AbrB family transcriptional regulator, transcriptional pleiotropic regulator of transition state genes
MRTGIRRKVDDLGRVVIPAGIRRTLGIREGDALEVHVEGEQVIFAKPSDQCVFCGREDELRQFRKRSVCRPCVAGVGVLDERLRDDRAAEPPGAEKAGVGRHQLPARLRRYRSVNSPSQAAWLPAGTARDGQQLPRPSARMP